MESRNGFGKFVQGFKKTGIGAEIGVADGAFSRLIAERWDGIILCVDIWENADWYHSLKNNALSGDQYRLIRGNSVDVANTIEDGSLDWIYIDADHKYESVMADYHAWMPKVRLGGIVSGHDYGDNEPGVKKFVDSLHLEINTTTHDGDNPSWWYIKQ